VTVAGTTGTGEALPPPSSARVGAAGGVIGVGQARVTIPAGALSADTQVSIAEVEGDDLLMGPAYDLQPDGLQLAAPATLSIRYTSADIPAGYSPEGIAIASPDEHYQPAGGDPVAALTGVMPYFLETTVDTANAVVTAEIPHFSRYGGWPISTFALSPGNSAVFVDPALVAGRAGTFDMGVTENGFSTNDGSGVAEAQYVLLLRQIALTVQTLPGQVGDLYAHGLIAKLFKVTAGTSPQPLAAGVECILKDTGGAATGNSVWGERRMRLMDMGRGRTAGTRVPVQLDEEGTEWITQPSGLGLPSTPHPVTPPTGQSMLLAGTLEAGHYYAIVVDLWALAGVNDCSSPTVGCPSSQVWAWDEFEVLGLSVDTP